MNGSACGGAALLLSPSNLTHMFVRLLRRVRGVKKVRVVRNGAGVRGKFLLFYILLRFRFFSLYALPIVESYLRHENDQGRK